MKTKISFKTKATSFVAFAFLCINLLVNSQTTDEKFREMKNEIKRKSFDFEIGKTSVSDVPTESLFGLKIPEGEDKRVKNYLPKSGLKRALPSYFSWKDKGKMTPMVNQGSCGSCWAFAAIAVYEANVKIKYNKGYDFSEQEINSCSQANGCSGGWAPWKYMKDTRGVALESCYRYTGTDNNCKSGCTKYFPLKSYWDVKNSINDIKEAVYNHGAVWTTVCVDSYFQNFNGGTFRHTSNGQVNHAVVICGWDDSRGAWLMKNSWGTYWGDSGYGWVAYNANSIGKYSSIAIPEGGSDGGDGGSTKGISPTGGSTLRSNSVNFSWDYQGDYHWIYVGTTKSGTDILDSKQINGKSFTVNNLPKTGTVHLRLWHNINGSWTYNDFTYTMNAGNSDGGDGTCSWILQSGKAIDVGAYGNNVYFAGADNYLYKSDGREGITSVDKTMKIKRLDVGKSGVWAINMDNRIWEYTGGKWVDRNGTATDIGASSEVYAIGTDNKVYKYLGRGWSHAIGSTLATDVDAARDDRPWIRGKDGYVYQWLGDRWDRKGSIKVLDVAINPEQDKIAVVGSDQSIKVYAGSGNYNMMPGLATRICINSDSKMWTVNNSNNIYVSSCAIQSANPMVAENVAGTAEQMVKHLNIYPNPTSDGIFTISGLSTEEKFKISLTSTNGQVVYNKTLSGENSIRVDLNETGLQKGLYFLTIESESYNHTAKIVVN